jgi:hypothetical protein
MSAALADIAPTLNTRAATLARNADFIGPPLELDCKELFPHELIVEKVAFANAHPTHAIGIGS